MPRGEGGAFRRVGAAQLSLVLLLVGAAVVSSAPTPPGGDAPRGSGNGKAPEGRTPVASPTSGEVPGTSSNAHAQGSSSGWGGGTMPGGGTGNAPGVSVEGPGDMEAGSGVVRWNHLGTLWRLPGGDTRWVPWYRDGAPGTDHSFSWENTEEDWRERVRREYSRKGPETAGGGERRRYFLSPIDGRPDNMEPGSTMAYTNRGGTQWILPGGRARWVPWPIDDQPETGPWYSWMPDETTWLERARHWRRRVEEERADRERRRWASTGWPTLGYHVLRHHLLGQHLLGRRLLGRHLLGERLQEQQRPGHRLLEYRLLEHRPLGRQRAEDWFAGAGLRRPPGERWVITSHSEEEGHRWQYQR